MNTLTAIGVSGCAVVTLLGGFILATGLLRDYQDDGLAPDGVDIAAVAACVLFPVLLIVGTLT